MSNNSPLRVVIFREGEAWVAQCVDYDIAAQAPTPEKLFQRFDMTVDAHLKENEHRGRKAFEGIPEAPERYEDMWARHAGKITPNGVRPYPIDLALAA